MPSALWHAEWLIDEKVAFGWPDSGIWNRTTPVVSSAGVRAGDVDRPRGDGVVFGVDYRGGQLVSFDLLVSGADSWATRELVDRLAAVWRADEVRGESGRAVALRCSYDGRERVAFGRPRRWAVDYSRITTGNLAAVQCDFACQDDLFYGAVERGDSLTIAPPQVGGLVAPLVAPLTTTRRTVAAMWLKVGSELPVWPVIEVHGPVAFPVVTIGSKRFEWRSTVTAGQTLVIDTRPWHRTVMVGAQGVAGAMRGVRLSDAALTPGVHEVVFKGIDATGTAQAVVSWRDTYTSL